MEMTEYLPIFLQVIIAVGIGIGILTMSHLFGQKGKSGKIKDFPPDLYGWIRGSIDRAGRSKNGNRNRRPRGHILEQFDTDRNGRLDSEELRKARAAINKKKQAPKPAIKTKKPAGK